MGTPVTVTDLLARRAAALASLQTAHQSALGGVATQTDSKGQTASLNVAPPPAALTVVCWNVQTFFANKSVSNPLVNRVINGLLKALSADVCILLETRENAYVNLGAIEENLKGELSLLQKFREVPEDDELEMEEVAQDPAITADAQDDGDDEEDGEDVDSDEEMEEDDSQGSTDSVDGDTKEDESTKDAVSGVIANLPEETDPYFLQVATEMTGKRWQAPQYIFVPEASLEGKSKLMRLYPAFKALLDKVAALPAAKATADLHKEAKALSNAKPKPAMNKTDAQKARYRKLSREDQLKERTEFDNEWAKKPRKPAKSIETRCQKLSAWLVRKGVKASRKVVEGFLNAYFLYIADPTCFDTLSKNTDAENTLIKAYGYCPRLLGRLCNRGKGEPDTWKALAQTEEMAPLQMYYDVVEVLSSDPWQETVYPFDASTSSWKVLTDKPALPGWQWYFRLKKCPMCGHALGRTQTVSSSNLKEPCSSCVGYLDPQRLQGGGSAQEISSIDFSTGNKDALAARTNRITPNLANLRSALDSFVNPFYSSVVEESYAILVRGSDCIKSPSSEGVFLQDKRTLVHTTANRLLLRGADHVTTEATKTTPAAYTSGTLLGYQADFSGYYGRNPCLLPLSYWLPYANDQRYLDLVAFHAPYGADTNYGLLQRKRAMEDILKAASNQRTEAKSGMALQKTIGEVEAAMVIGDFNLSWDGNFLDTKQLLAVDAASGKPGTVKREEIAQALYTRMKMSGFLPRIGAGTGVSTSLKATTSKDWTSLKGPTSEFTSSAYDNVFLRAPKETEDNFIQAAVIDVIEWMVQEAATFPMPEGAKVPPNWDTLDITTKAFYLYRTFVSDHLPVVCELAVAGMPGGPEAAQESRRNAGLRTAASAQQGNQILRDANIPLQFSFFSGFPVAVEPSRDADSIAQIDARTVTVCGTVVGQHTGGAIWISAPNIAGREVMAFYRLPYAQTRDPAALQAFCSSFPRGTRVRVVLGNYREQQDKQALAARNFMPYARKSPVDTVQDDGTGVGTPQKRRASVDLQLTDEPKRQKPEETSGSGQSQTDTSTPGQGTTTGAVSMDVTQTGIA